MGETGLGAKEKISNKDSVNGGKNMCHRNEMEGPEGMKHRRFS